VIIKNRWSGDPIELPDDCPRDSMKVILEWCARRAREGKPSANLRGANLWGANLQGANLQGANLQYASLNDANLRGANLQYASLNDASLCGANLQYAKWSLKTKWPSPTTVMLANWGDVSNELTSDLMRYDSACHPDPKAFTKWVAGGNCPYDGVNVSRAASFNERRECWNPKSRLKRPYDLMMRLLAEKCEKVD